MTVGPAVQAPAAWIDDRPGGDPDTDMVVILGYD
jgi:hypothetical protein